MDPIELSLFTSRIEAVCEEMGEVLKRSAFSPNIKDRLDFSCAVFDAQGALCAQAAHIPVHLGSMAYAMGDIVQRLEWRDGDMIILNDPYLGGTHLPDVTVIAPVYVDQQCIGFVANRAHHADIGADSPGSMPISRRIEEEGLLIAPTVLVRDGRLDHAVLDELCRSANDAERMRGDFTAQISANRAGVQRLSQLVRSLGRGEYAGALTALNEYAERLARSALSVIPQGCYRFQDWLDGDGVGGEDLPIAVSVTVTADNIRVDFTGTAAQCAGNLNCPLSVAAAGVYYVFRCLLPDHTPVCAGTFRCLEIHAPPGSLLNAQRPAAVAAGNVETSTRVVDVLMGALAQALPEVMAAASQGSMNNLAMGARRGHVWDYYETLGGGMGAGPNAAGLHAVQTHMTNTLNTPIEVLESLYPVRISRYAIRRGSGGNGTHRGGDGLIREFTFLAPAEVTLLTERRRHAPWGLAGGASGQCGINRLNGAVVPGKVHLQVQAGDVLRIETPGGGGWGSPTAV